MLNYRQLFLDHMAPTSEFPLMLEIERSEGVYLYNTQGEKLMDLISGIGVSNLGHRHPAVLQAIQEQLDKYLHTMVYGEYVLAPQVELAELLTSHLPENLNSVYYVNSGSEATEGAMKLAKRYTGRSPKPQNPANMNKICKKSRIKKINRIKNLSIIYLSCSFQKKIEGKIFITIISF